MWQPIETAPKDQTVVLLYCTNKWDTDGVLVGFWSDDGLRPAWYDCESASHSIEDIYGAPTHWMALPDPPQPDAELTTP